MAKPDHKLTDEMRAFIVTRLAWRDSPTSIANQVKEEFAITITRQTVEGYDPVKMARRGKSLAEKWITLYESTRAAIENGVAEIGMSDRLVRLARMERIFHLFMERGNLVEARNTIIEAEKMQNDFYAKRGVGLGAFFGEGEGEGAGEDHHGGFDVEFVRAKDGAPVN